MEPILHFLQEEPIVSFAILLAVILTVPVLFERLKLPGILGLLLAGVALGPYGLQLLTNKSETMKLLSDIGLVYLMFVAGLEVDIAQFRKTKHRSMGFGGFTFAVPLVFGILVGRVFGFGWNASILMGSLFASHTLLAYPIVSRLGVVTNEAVTVTIGATIFTDIGSLLVLAVCTGVHAGDFNLLNLLILLVSLAIYSASVLFGFDWLGREFFRRSGNEEGNQFLFVLLAVFLSAVGAQAIGVEKIVGAFLAGLAVNDAVGEGPVKEKVVFVGSVLFIPIFFVNMGLLINVPAFVQTLASPWLTLAIVVGLILSKFLAALFAKLVYRYSFDELLVMWSLSLPQVAATLAATLVGYRVGLLTEAVLNSVIVLMLVTATLGPLITSWFAPRLVVNTAIASEGSDLSFAADSPDHRFTVVVPVYNPQTERYLLEMAALLVQYERGRVVPLALATTPIQMETEPLEAAIARSEKLLQRATVLGEEMGVEVDPLLRIDDNIAVGIARASREQQANLIVMGWAQRTGFRARLFGNVIDRVLWLSHCPVAISRLLASPTQMQRILVPVEHLSPQAIQVVRLAHILAQANQAQVTLLHVCDRSTTATRRAWIQSQLELLSHRISPNLPVQVQVTPSDQVVQSIVEAAKGVDLVVLRSQRKRTSAGGLAIGDVTAEVVQRITCSVVMLGEPSSVQASNLLRTEQPKLANTLH